MTNPSKAVKPVPDGYTSVTPWIISRNSAALIEFLQQAFQAEELARVYVGDGIIGHAEVRIGDAVVMMFDAKPEWPDSPAYLRIYLRIAMLPTSKRWPQEPSRSRSQRACSSVIGWDGYGTRSATYGGFRREWRTSLLRKWNDEHKTRNTSRR